jgi:hypothetical protein
MLSALYLPVALLATLLITSCGNRTQINPYVSRPLTNAHVNNSRDNLLPTNAATENLIREQNLVRADSELSVDTTSKALVLKTPIGITIDFSKALLKPVNANIPQQANQKTNQKTNQKVEQLIISGIDPKVKFDTFMLDNPSRIVLDLFTTGNIKPQNLKISK